MFQLTFGGMLWRPFVILVTFHNSKKRKFENIFFFIIFCNNVTFYLVTEIMHTSNINKAFTYLLYNRQLQKIKCDNFQEFKA